MNARRSLVPPRLRRTGRILSSSSSWRLLSYGTDTSIYIIVLDHSEIDSAQLKSAEVDLETARNHVQQFQEISQASEAALQSLSTSYDEYKASTDAQIIKLEVSYSFDEEGRCVLTSVKER